MFLTVHTTAAIVIGTVIPNPVGAFFIGIGSHYLLDMIPHGDEEKWLSITNYQLAKLTVIDHPLLLLNMTMLFLFKSDFIFTYSIIAAIIGSVLPDYIMGFYRLTKDKKNRFAQIIHNTLNPVEKMHTFIHFDIIKYELPFAAGMTLQALSWMLLVYII